MKVIRIKGQPDIPVTPEVQHLLDVLVLGRVSAVEVDAAGHVVFAGVEGETGMVDVRVVES